MTDTIWSFEGTTGYQAGTDLTGFDVEAIDGRIGKVDKHSEEVGTAYLVVDTGIWIFGRHVLLPAGTISSIDVEATTIYLSRTKDDIAHAPEFDKDKHIDDDDYHQRLTGYYGAPHS
ncbi:PRC-barrel domain containing protein [Streptomyces sioyaensis]|uniref:PRC-barrel domain containing protein n=1 Tax=Streptomyces sioyaensis TaxID=67364 RepID=A0A4Q1QSH3_9ACTN|nr:PRC-barrel domain-containing protein [Streptomyces sioyaensis]MBM4792316.1 PRC-barrel domain containing protein [Streptomyces sioyaensis]RXS66032.1 PRC-barrel domain containing protein [Streptomyces sioyaensis]